MTDISFSQPERRNFAIPATIAIAILAAAIGIFFWLTPLHSITVSIPHTATLPTHTVFPTATRIVGMSDPAEDAFYVLATVHIHNNLHIPIFLKDITGSVIAPDQTEITATAIEKTDLPNIYVTFPKLKPLSSAPLYREITIQPGSDAEGMVVLNFPIDQKTWDGRKSATVTLDFYHQGKFTVEIPGSAPAGK